MRRSRKSRSGSANMTQLNQMIRSSKASTIVEQQIQKVNLEIINKEKLEIVEKPPIVEQVTEPQQSSTELAVLIKSPQTQYMFDKRFEMTEDSMSIHSSV